MGLHSKADTICSSRDGKVGKVKGEISWPYQMSWVSHLSPTFSYSKLSLYVTNKSNRFGAVLDRDAFENAVYETFVVGRVF